MSLSIAKRIFNQAKLGYCRPTIGCRAVQLRRSISTNISLFHNKRTRKISLHSHNHGHNTILHNNKDSTRLAIAIHKRYHSSTNENSNTNDKPSSPSVKAVIDSTSADVLNPLDNRTRDYFYNYREIKQSGAELTDDIDIDSITNNSASLSESGRREFNLNDTKSIFAAFSTRELLQTYFLFQLCSSKLMTTLMIKIMNDAVGTPMNDQPKWKQTLYSPMLWMVKKQYFLLFTGGETLQECKDQSTRYLGNGIRLIIDNSTEEAYGFDAWNQNAQAKKDIIKLFSTNLTGFVDALPLKLTALTSGKLLEEMTDIIMNKNPKDLDPVPLLKPESQKELNDAFDRLSDITAYAQRKNMKIWLDAEQYNRQPGMNYVARILSNKFNRNGEIWVFNTYQMYLRDAPEWVEFDIDYAKRNNHGAGIKLVRGAYLSYETAKAKEQGLLSPITQSKHITDGQYNNMVRRVIKEMGETASNTSGGGHLGVAVCTHNRQSVETAVAALNLYGVTGTKTENNVRFAQLRGMADNLTFGLGICGFNALKLIPYGDFEDVWPYLMRRLEENQDMLSGMTQEKKLYFKEIKRRTVPFFGSDTSKEKFKNTRKLMRQSMKEARKEIGGIKSKIDDIRS